MKLDISNEYRICTDEFQFIVQQKKVVQENKLTNPENIGKEYWKDIAYCNSLDFALKFICKNVLLTNDDINVIIDKLNEIESKIEEIEKYLSIKRNVSKIKEREEFFECQ